MYHLRYFLFCFFIYVVVPDLVCIVLFAYSLIVLVFSSSSSSWCGFERCDLKQTDFVRPELSYLFVLN